tara:strand:- start:241 stop:1080 length:840 start_codon:yes stop_codon:yes gene_type:complete
MPKNTLLGLLTGGRYMQSSDLPTVKQVGSSAIDKIIESDNKRRGKVLFKSGKNIFGKPVEEFTQGDLEDLIMGGVAGTTKPIMSKLGMREIVPKNPLYHITDIGQAGEILNKPMGGILPRGGSLSFTRDPNLQEVYGKGKKSVQFLLDKDRVEEYAGKKLSPYQYVGGRAEGKGGLRFEAEERLTSERLGAPLTSIKAIRLRNIDKFPVSSEYITSRVKEKRKINLFEVLKGAEKRNVPIVTDMKYKKKIDKLIDKSVSPTVSDFFRNRLKENVHYVGK